MIQISKAILCCLMLSAAAPLPAFADNTPSEPETVTGLRWEQDPDNIWIVDGSDAGFSADLYGYSRIIKSAGTTGPIIIFNCYVDSKKYETLNTGIQLDPNSTYADNPERTPRILTLTGVLTIDGKTKNERFRYHPASSKIVPFDKAVARRIYNAAVTGAETSIKVQGKLYNLEMPATDKTFVSFAKNCPTTNGGKFDYTIFETYRSQARAD